MDNKTGKDIYVYNRYSTEQIDLAIDWLTDAKNMYLRHIPATNVNEIHDMIVDILKGER